MELTRSQKHALEAKERYLANSKAIFEFCILHDIPQKYALKFSLMAIDHSDFVWFHENTEGTYKKLFVRLKKRLKRIEQNRLLGATFGPLDIRELPD